MNDPSVLSSDAPFASEREIITETRHHDGRSREMLLGHVVLTLLFLVAVLLRMLL